MGNWFSVNELSIVAGLPQKEVVGLSLREEVEFGLNYQNDIDEDNKLCTSQQKVDTTLYFYTSFNEHNTPYTVLESDNSESMPDVLH